MGSKLRIKIEDSSSENGSDDEDDEMRNNNDDDLERIVVNKIESGSGNFFKIIRKEINSSKNAIINLLINNLVNTSNLKNTLQSLNKFVEDSKVTNL